MKNKKPYNKDVKITPSLSLFKVVAIIFFFGIVVPVVGAYLAYLFLGDHQTWVNIPLHSFLESTGGAIALVLAIMILINSKSKKNYRYAAVAFGFISMGALDMLHSMVEPGNNFVWLHNLAILSGGLFFFLSILPRKMLQFFLNRILKIFLVFTVAVGAVSMAFPNLAPPMLLDGRFTLFALEMNYAASALFLLFAFHFIYRYEKESDKIEILFAIMATLLGFSGFMFVRSSIWDSVWWWWHLIRFLAYGLALYYIFTAYRETTEKLQEFRKDIETALSWAEERRTEAEKSKEELEKINNFMIGRELKMIELKKEIERFKNSKTTG